MIDYGNDPTNLLLPALMLVSILGGLLVLLMMLTARQFELPPPGSNAIRAVSLVFSVANLALGIWLMFLFDWQRAGDMQFLCSIDWAPELGLTFSFGADAISLYLIVLTTLMMPVITLVSWKIVPERVAEFHVWLLVLEAAMLGVFMAQDLIFFYGCFEVTLIPMYFLISVWGSAQRLRAARIFFLYTFTGSSLTLVALLYVAWFNASLSPGQFEHAGAGTWSFALADLLAASVHMNATEQTLVFLGLLCGFAVKVPLFPVHTWLPLAHTEAPTAGSVDLAAVLLKLGTYGILRFAIPMCPVAAIDLAPLVGTLAVIGIIHAALICWVQKDLKKLIAYSSVSHMGFCVLGMFALNAEGVGGSVAYMVNHGLSTGALFLMVGMLYERLHTRDMTNFGGLAKLMPLWAGFFVFFALASVGLPGLNGFVGEFLCLVGTFKAQGVLGPGFAIVGGLGIILAAVYILYMVGKVVWGPLKLPADYDAKHHPLKDMDAREVLTVLPLAALCLFLGFFPTPMLVGMEESVAKVTQPAERVLAQRAQQQREQQPGEATPKLTDREDQAAAQARAETAPKPRLGDRPTPDLSDGPLGRPSAGRPGSGLLTAKDRPVGPARGR